MKCSPLFICCIFVLTLFVLPMTLVAEEKIMEDFEGGSLASITPFFSFAIDERAGVEFPTIRGSRSLFLSSIENQKADITFDLMPGQLVQQVSVDVLDASGSRRGPGPHAPETRVRFIGSESSALFSTSQPAPGQRKPFETFSTVGLGSIQAVELLPSLESYYDNLVVTIVPEPNGNCIYLLSIAFLCLVNHGRKHYRICRNSGTC